MTHHITQTIGQLTAQTLPHLAGTAPAPTPTAPTPTTSNQKPLEAFQTWLSKTINAGKIPTEDEFYAMMNKAVLPGALVFWSALGGPNLSSQEAAKNHAAHYNMQLLRPLMQKFDEGYLDTIIFDKIKGVNYEIRQQLVDMTWSRASSAFARHVKGRAIVVSKGDPATNGAITWPSDEDFWTKDEFPVLIKQGSTCTEILRVNADDWRPGENRRLKGKIVWTKKDGVLPLDGLRDP